MSSIRTFFSVLWDPRTWASLLYLLLGLPLGVLWFTWAVTMYAVGAALVIIWVGIPILVFTQMSMRWIGAVERGQANGLLGAGIDRPQPVRPRPGAAGAVNWWMRSVHWSGARMHDAHAWRVAVWSLVRGVLGPLGFAVALVAVLLPVSLLFSAVMYTLNDLGVIPQGWEQVDGGNDWQGPWWYLAYPVGVLLAVAGAWLVRAMGRVHVPLARWALGSCESERVRRATERAELAEERVRIDQELHDSIGHMITMTIVQAGAGAHVFDSDPEFARQALRNIEQRGRAAMGELDRIIAELRGDDSEARAPLPGIADVPALIDSSRAAGMEIDATVNLDGGAAGDAGAPLDVAPAVGRAVFGVVREALTNAAKHAPGAAVTVTVQPDADALAIRVTNGAPAVAPAPAQAGRRGVAGMRDRIALLGGASRIGPTKDGFEVLALVPLGASLAPTSEPGSPWSELRETVSS